MLNAPEIDSPFRPVTIDEESLLVVYNPTNPVAREHANHLRFHAREEWTAGPVFVAPTEKTVEATAEMMGDIAALGPHKVVVLGGDGTAAKTISAERAIGLNPDNAVSADGYANDLGSTLNKKRYRRRPITALLHGLTGDVYPLEITITGPGGNVREVEAINYAGIGLTGDLGYFFDSDTYRKLHRAHEGESQFRQRAREIRIVDRYLRSEARPYYLTDEAGNTRVAYEYLVLQGARIAKTWLKKPDHLFRPYASIGELGEAKRRKVAKTVGGMAFNGSRTLQKGEQSLVTVNFDGDRAVLMQHDGEWLELEDGSSVRFAISDKPFRAVKTRP